MPDQLTPEDQQIFEQAFGTPAQGGLTPEDQRIFDEAFNEKQLDLMGDTPAALSRVADTTQSVANVQPVGPNLSIIDDFRPKIQKAAKGLLRGRKTTEGLAKVIGPAASQVPSDLFSSDEILAHAASSGLGDVWSVAKDPAAKADWYRTGIRRAARFMSLAGFDKVAKPEETAEITAAYLFGELALRTPMHEESLGRANRHALKTMVAERRAAVAEQAQGGLVGQDAAFFNAAAYLDSMDEEESTVLRGFLLRTTQRPARNEQEALLAKRNDDIWGGEQYDFAQPGPGFPREARSANRALSALKIVLGTDHPDENALNRMEQSEHAWRLKDLGFLDGDLTRPGVRIPNATGGFVESMLVPNETLSALQRRKKELGVLSPFDAGPDDIEGISEATGLDPEAAKKLSESVAAAVTAGAAAGQVLPADRSQNAEELTPGEWDSLRWTEKAKARAYGVFGDAFTLARKPFDAAREAMRGRLGGDIGQMGVQLLTGREDLAREADDVFDIASTAFSLLAQYEDVKAFGEGKAQEILDPNRAAILNEMPAMRAVDSKLASEILAQSSASATWGRAKKREDVRREEEERQGRMSTFERGLGGSVAGYLKDMFVSGFHNAYEGLGLTAAQVIDDPQLVPLLMGADRISDAAITAPFSALRNAAKVGLNAQAAKQSMRQILQHAPHEVARLRRIATERLAKATTQEQGVAVLRDLAAAAADLEEQWSAVRRGGRSPGRDSIERVATAWRQSADYGVDFDTLDRLPESMVPEGALPLLAAAKASSAKAPIHLTPSGLAGLSKSYREMANRVLPSLGRSPMSLDDALDLERKATQGDAEAAQELVRRQGGYNRNLGVAERIEMLTEIEGLYRDLQQGVRVEPGRFEELRTRLWGSADMDPLDWATLMQLDDVKRWAPNSPVDKFLARMQGYNPEQLRKLQKSARTVLDFASRDALDFYLAKSNNELTNLRRTRAYEYAKAKVRLGQREAMMAGDARGHAELSTRLNQLDVEHRRASSNPVSEPFTLDDGKILMQTLDDGDLGYVVENNPELFGGAQRTDFDGREVRGLYETRALRDEVVRYRILGQADNFEQLKKAIRDGNQAVAMEKKAALVQDVATSVDETMLNIPEFQAIAKEPNALKLLGFDLDSFGMAGMPFWALSRNFREIPRNVAYRQAVDYERLADLHKKLEEVRRTLTPEESKLLDRDMAARGPITVSPELEYAMEMVYPDGNGTKARNVRQLMAGVEEFRASKINDMYDLGMTDKYFTKELLEKGYDPNVYELHETPRHVRMARSAKGGVKMIEGQDLSTLKFQRSLTHHRVRVREADGFIRDEQFATEYKKDGTVKQTGEAKARAWVRRTYGARALELGKTPSGEEIHIAAPLDAESRYVLGLVEGMTGEAQLLRLQNLSRDIHTNLFLRSLRPSGLVASPKEFTRLFLEEGKGQVDLEKQFETLPDDRAAFGDMAGWKVHKKVFAELAAASHSFDQFRTWQEAIQNVYRAAGGDVPTELANRAPGRLGKIYRGSIRAAKSALILNNWRVWVGNATFNMVLSNMVGGRIFAAENRAALRLAWRETFGGGKGGRSKEWLEFVKQGFGTSGAFDLDLPQEKVRNEMRLLGLNSADKLKGRIAKYEGVLRSFHEAQKRGEKPALLEKVQNHIVTLRAALDHHERGFFKRFGEWLAGYFLVDRDLFNQPRNKVAARMKQLYGSVDDFFKFANYLTLKEKVGASRAAWEVREHFQDYSRLPWGIHAISNNVLGAMVPSFGYELLRISHNLMKNHPLRFLSLLALVPAMNQSSEMAAGMTTDRVDAFLHQAGHRNKWERTKSYLSELRIWDPVTHRPIVSVPLTNFLPFANMFEGRGFMAQAAEDWFPEEDRGVGKGLMATGLEAAGLFFLNNPVFNTLGVVGFNRDPVTGQEVLDRETARPRDYMKAFTKHFVRNFIPRTGMMLADDLPASLSAPVDPTTGRSVGATSPLELLSAEMGVRIRGLDAFLRSRGVSQGHPLGRDEALVKSVVYAVMGTGKDTPGRAQFGADAEIRELIARRDEPGLTPERRAAYDASIKELLRKERTIDIPGQEVNLSSTEREELMRFAALERRGLPQAIALATPQETAAIMIWLDRAGLGDHNLAEVSRMILRTPLNRPRFEDDPESMDRAIKMLDTHLRDKTSSKTLTEVRDWWALTRNKAAGLERRRRLREAARKQ